MKDIDLFITFVATDFYKKSDVVIILEGDGINRISKACKIYNNQLADFIVFSGGVDNIKYGSYTFEKCAKEFKKSNINPNKIIIEEKSQNTRHQAENIIDLCLTNNWNSIILTASHYHQFRAFLTFLKVLIEKKLEKKIIIYNAIVNNLNWYKETGWGIRIELLKLEFKKINKYQKENDVASFREAIEYFKWREQNI